MLFQNTLEDFLSAFKCHGSNWNKVPRLSKIFCLIALKMLSNFSYFDDVDVH